MDSLADTRDLMIEALGAAKSHNRQKQIPPAALRRIDDEPGSAKPASVQGIARNSLRCVTGYNLSYPQSMIPLSGPCLKRTR